MTTTALWPPKPNELLIATMSPCRQVAGAGDDVQRDLRVLVVEVDGHRGDALVDGQHGQHGLQRAGAAEQVPGLRLGGGDGDVVDLVAEGGLAARCTRHVADRGAGGVGVDVDHSSAWRRRVEQGRLQGAGRAQALGVGRGDVVGVGGDAGAGQFGVDVGAAGQGVLLGLEHERAGAFAHDEAVAVDVVGARGGARGRRCAWTAPASRRTRRSGAGGWPPRCRRR